MSLLNSSKRTATEVNLSWRTTRQEEKEVATEGMKKDYWPSKKYEAGDYSFNELVKLGVTVVRLYINHSDLLSIDEIGHLHFLLD